MQTPTAAEFDAVQRTVYAAMPATPQYAWPLLAEALGAEVWVKHENHTPLGAFKVRGGLVYMQRLSEREPRVRGVISATRGNHGQSIAFAARRHGMTATIVVPHGNSVEKNAASAELIEHGDDFQASREHAAALATQRELHFVERILAPTENLVSKTKDADKKRRCEPDHMTTFAALRPPLTLSVNRRIADEVKQGFAGSVSPN